MLWFANRWVTTLGDHTATLTGSQANLVCLTATGDAWNTSVSDQSQFRACGFRERWMSDGGFWDCGSTGFS
jgi:hypothetical protein